MRLTETEEHNVCRYSPSFPSLTEFARLGHSLLEYLDVRINADIVSETEWRCSRTGETQQSNPQGQDCLEMHLVTMKRIEQKYNRSQECPTYMLLVARVLY